MAKYVLSFLLIPFFFATCTKTNYRQLFNTEIVIPGDLYFTIRATDTINIDLYDKYKIVKYIDSAECFGCEMKEHIIGAFLSDLEKKFHGDVPFLVFVHPLSMKDIKLIIERDDISFPICIDLYGIFAQRNKRVLTSGYNCFLLDENNRVVLIGNPVQNTKIRELYIRTICERLGINPQSLTNTQNTEYHANMGVFPWQEAQTTKLVLHNTTQTEMQIDSIRTSCECTTATADKTIIAAGDSTAVSVLYQAESAGQFLREVYVYIHGSEAITLQIEGEGN